MKESVSHARLKELLHYDPITGVFVWLTKPRRKKMPEGNVAGHYWTNGRGQICIAQKFYRMHRLAWFYMTGEWPKGDIDHIDGNPSNNVFSNLRDVPHQINAQNRRKSANRAGLLGVRQKSANSFTARIVVDGKELHLGSFKTGQEAHEAYVQAKRQLHAGCTI